MLAEYSNLATIIVTGIVILTGFILLKVFKTIFSFGFIGMVLSLYSYLVCDYYVYDKVPVLSIVGLVLCLIGITRSGILKKVFATIGLLVSIINILGMFGIAV